MKYALLFIIVALSHNCSLVCRVSSGDVQDSLEPNVGFYESQYLGSRSGPPVKSDLFSFKISSNDKYLAFTGWSIFSTDSLEARIVIYDLQLNTIVTRIPYSNISKSQFWFLDSNHLLYQSFGPVDTAGHTSLWYIKLNLPTLGRDSVGGAGWTSNMIIGSVGSDRMGYFVNADGSSGSRLLLDSVFDSSKPVLGEISSYSGPVVCGKPTSYVPQFPPCNCEYSITPIMDCDSSQRYFNRGFAIIHNFDYQQHSKEWSILNFPNADTSRIMQLQSVYSVDNYCPGSNGDIFFELGHPNRIVSKREIDKGLPDRFESNPFDSVMLSARAMWGYYRVDSSGSNLIQLVREWWGTHIQASCTGRVYYVAYSVSDSCASIWSMDRNGMSKQRIYTIGKQTASEAVEEQDTDGSQSTIFISPKYDEIQFRRSEKRQCISCTIFNVMGRAVGESSSSEANENLKIDISSLADGLYFVWSNCTEGQSLRKFVILR